MINYAFPMRHLLALSVVLVFLLGACGKSDTDTPKLAFDYAFEANQPRLNNLGQPAALPAGHAALTPDFKSMSVHYIELAPTATTLLGKGAILYQGAETTKGGDKAVDFDQAPNLPAGQQFAELDLGKLPAGTYEWVRVSVTYQAYDIRFNLADGPFPLQNQKGRVASFVGFNTYISKVKPREKELTVSANKRQGFWAFETELEGAYAQYNNIFSGEAPAGATTVVNPLFATSPVPPGSCVVTGRFAQPLVITGDETENLVISLSFSIKQSFEWEDNNGNGQWDIYRV